MKRNSISYVVALIFIAVISHWQWFNFSSVLNFSDWYYWPNEPVAQLWNSWGAWISFWNFGLGNIQLYFNMFNAAWAGIVSIGFSYDAAAKITFFIPIALLGFLSPFFLFQKLTKDNLLAFVVALFYGTTTYFLIKQTGHLPIALLYSLLPLLFLLFLRALEKNALSRWLQFTLLFWLMSVYEIRIVYLISFVLLFYLLKFHTFELKEYVRNIFISGTTFLLLSAFWLLPTVFGGLASDVSATANRGLFGGGLFNIEQAFALFESSWTGGYPDMNFHPQPIPIYFWVIPLFIFFTFVFVLIFGKDTDLKKKVLFFGVVSLVGIFLTKQSGQPLEFVYEWLYVHFPGFNLFREASKFYILTAFGYAGLLGYGLLFVRNFGLKRNDVHQNLFRMTCGAIIVLSLWNLKPLVTGEIGTLFVSRHIPNDYVLLEKYIFNQENQSEYFRTLWSPTYSRWGAYDNEHPKISNIDVIQSIWNELSLGDRLLEELPGEERITHILKQPFSNVLLDTSSIKYVIVPVQDIANDDNFFKYYGERQFFIDELDKLPYLKKIDIGTSELVAYENADFRPHIYATEAEETIHDEVPFENLDFKFKNPTEYSVNLKNVSDPVYVNFSEKYHSDWKLRVGEFQWFDVLKEKSYFLPDTFHSENNAKLNSFLIDPDYIKENLPKDRYHENPDGSIDLELTLYFKPQSYFYLGLVILGATFAACLGYFGWVGVRSWREKMGWDSSASSE